MAGKIAGKALARGAARAALNLHPLGRAVRLAMDLYQLGDELGWFMPGKPEQPGHFPGFQLIAKHPTLGQEVISYHSSQEVNPNIIKLVNDGGRTVMFEKPMPVPPSQNGIIGAAKNALGYGWVNYSAYWWHPPGTRTEPVVWQEPVPAEAPQFVPAAAPAPRRSPSVSPRHRPQRRPGISYGKDHRPNNFGTIELSVTGTRVRLRLNGENRPPRSGERETKSRSASWKAMYALYRLADWSTEAVDFLEVLAKATGYKGPDGAENARAMIEHVASNLHQFDAYTFVVEYLLNELEDQLIGRLSGLVDGSSKKLGIRNPEIGLGL